MHLAVACDLVVMAEEARFISVFIRRGIAPDAGGAYLLTRLVGPQKAKELFFFGDDIPAADELDLIADLAGKLPMDVVSELMGVPVADRDELRRLADLVLHREPGLRDVPPAGVDATLELVAYYADLVADRRRRPTEDLTSALVAAEIDGARLSDDDIIAFLFLMVVAGNETTTKLLGHAWYWAWRKADERLKALRHVDAVPGAPGHRGHSPARRRRALRREGRAAARVGLP